MATGRCAQRTQAWPGLKSGVRRAAPCCGTLSGGRLPRSAAPPVAIWPCSGPEVAVTEEVLSEDELAEQSLHILDATQLPLHRNIPQPRSLAVSIPTQAQWKDKADPPALGGGAPRWSPAGGRAWRRDGRWSLRIERKARPPGDWRRGEQSWGGQKEDCRQV